MPLSTPDQIALKEVLSDELTIGVSSFVAASDSFESVYGDDEIKFHFSLCGKAECDFQGRDVFEIGDLAAVVLFQGRGVQKRLQVDGKNTTFTVTLVCRPSFLISRLGICPEKLPRPIAKLIETGEANWFWEAGRMTPAMASAVRSFAANPYEGAMRRAYFEARSIELICDMCAEIGVGVRRFTPNSQSVRRVQLAKSIIDEKFAQDLSVDRLARSVGTNRTMLSQIFRQETGTTLFEYLSKVRMENAWGLLTDTELPISAIADAVGYRHRTNFGLAFKAHFGITPGQLRSKQSR